MSNPPSDLGIPVLTEVIDPQSRADSKIPAAAPSAAAPTSPPRKPETAAAPVPSRMQPPPAPRAAPVPAQATMQAPAPAPATATPENLPGAQAEALTPAAPVASAGDDSELRDLENELRLRITRQVLDRIDFVLDHRVRNTLSEVVDTAVDALAAEIKRGLHETLTDLVARAVAQEVARLQNAKK